MDHQPLSKTDRAAASAPDTPLAGDGYPTEAECQRRLGANPELGAAIDHFIAHPETGVRRERPARRLPTFDLDKEYEAVALDAHHLGKDGEARGAWVDALAGLLPAHTYNGPEAHNFKWTTRRGTWRMLIRAHVFTPVGVEVVGPGGKWNLPDHRVPYVTAFLRLVGAIR